MATDFGKKLLALALAAQMSLGGVALAKSEDATFIASSDTYTSSLQATKGYSTAKDLVVSANDDDVRKAYIGFNVGVLPTGDDVKIFLRLTPTKVAYALADEGEVETSVSVWGLKTHNWKQGSVTSKNAPAAGSKLSALELKEGEVCEVDVTDYVKTNLSKEGYISFMIAEDIASGSEFAFASREAAQGKPELFIDVDYVAPVIPEGEATPAPTQTVVTVKDYNEIFTTGELKHLNTDPMITEAPYIEYPDLSGIPDDVYIEDFTTVRINKHLVNYVTGEPGQVENMLKGRNTAQITYCLAISPYNMNKMLIGSDCEAIYRTEDGGKTMQVSSTGISGNGINDIAYYPDDDTIAFALVTTKESNAASGIGYLTGIHKSTDSGATWEYKKSGVISLLSHLVTKAIAFGENKVNGVYPIYVSGTYDTGVWRSMDLGETWECVLEGTSGGHIETYGDSVIVSTGTNGVMVSHDMGETWENMSGNLSGYNIISTTVDPANKHHWICGTDDGDRSTKDGDLWETFDEGKTWTWIANRDNMLINHMAGVMYGPLDKKTGKARLYLRSDQNQYTVRYSDDDGRSWVRPYYVSPGAYKQTTGAYWASPLAFCRDYPDVVAGGVENLCISLDKGTSFYTRSFGRSGARHIEIDFDPDNPSEMYFSHIDIGVIKTLPQKEGEWYPLTYFAPMYSEQIKIIRTVYALGIDPTNSDHIIFAENGWSGGESHNLFESWDGGYNYTMYTDQKVDAGPRMYWHQTDPNIIYLGTHRSEDGGKTWKKLPYSIGAVAPTNNDICYRLEKQYLYISEDRGDTWRLACNTKLLQGDKRLFVDLEDPYRVYTGTADYGLWIIDHGEATHRDSKNGLTKTRFAQREVTIEGIAQNPHNPDHIVAAGRSLTNNEPTPGIYESFDRGMTWRMIEVPPPADFFMAEFHPVYPLVYLSSSGGTYVYEYEKYDIERPDCYYRDTEGTFCEDEAKFLVDLQVIGEQAYEDYGRDIDLGIDKYVYEGDFLSLILETTDFTSAYLDVMFNDIHLEHRYYSQVERSLENGLVLLSDGDENGNLNLLWKKLTHGMAAKYLTRLLGMNGISTDVSAAEINRFMSDTTDAEMAHAIAVLYKHGILTGDDGFEFSPEKVTSRGEMAYLLGRTLKLYK